MRIRSSDGIDLAVHHLTPDLGGRRALLAHATGFHGRVWVPLASHLTLTRGNGLDCWAPDFRGHGDSPTPPDQPLHWQAFADDVLAVIDASDAVGTFGIGHSMGGAALVMAEARRPGTFSGLWLFEPVIFPPRRAGDGPDAGSFLADGARRRRDRFDSFEVAEANFAAKAPFDVLDPAALHEYVRHGFAVGDDGGVHLKCRPADEARIYEMGGTHDAWDLLPSVDVPVTVVRGGLGLPGPASVAEAVAARLPDGRLEVHDDLGHFGPLSHPEAMAASVLAAVSATR